MNGGSEGGEDDMGSEGEEVAASGDEDSELDEMSEEEGDEDVRAAEADAALGEAGCGWLMGRTWAACAGRCLQVLGWYGKGMKCC